MITKAPPVARAVAEPPNILWAPFELVLADVLLWLILGLLGILTLNITPLVFLGCGLACFIVLAVIGAREPHAATILAARFNRRLPRRGHGAASLSP